MNFTVIFFLKSYNLVNIGHRKLFKLPKSIKYLGEKRLVGKIGGCRLRKKCYCSQAQN
jgi:hypothetical protein